MIDVETAAREVEEFLQDYLEESDAEGYAVGVSGGLDSAVTLKLAVEAVGSENVRGLVMPGKPSREENMEDARELCKELDVGFHEIDIEPAVDSFTSSVPFKPGRVAEGNARVRTRMVLSYLVANQENLLVLGSSNKTEIMLGYFTKHGDGAADVKAIADLYKTEVRDLAGILGLDAKFVEKEPTAGMWEGQTDEDELGYSYGTIDQVLELLVEGDRSVEEVLVETGLKRDTVEDIAAMHENSEHKREPAPYPELR
ncbi:MAG: NAD+ synthase [Candidatus Nanohaloarchaea archaeon]